MTIERIRVSREVRQRLKDLKDVDIIQEEAGTDEPSYEEVLDVVLPDKSEVGEKRMERKEEDMVFINLDETYYRTHELAGENVSAHRVLEKFTKDFAKENDIEYNNE
ncbi:MAG: hypothetical protein ABEK59_01255 [Halobacteria archaeon]